MSEEDDPLKELHVDKNELNRERLSKAIKKYMGIDQETGDPHFRPPFNDLTKTDKITVFLLYRQAARALGHIEDENLGVTSKEISEETGINYSTVRGQISQLDYVKNEEDKGGYYLPPYGLEPAIKAIEDG